MTEFYKPSSIALKENTGNRYEKKYNFPFERVPVGMSFSVAFDQVKSKAVLATIANRESKKLNRKFRVIQHPDGFEVYHVGPLEGQEPPVVPPESPWLALRGKLEG